MISPSTFNGTALQTADWQAFLVNTTEAMGSSGQSIMLPVTGGVPRDEGFNLSAISFTLGVIIAGASDLSTQVNLLKALFARGTSAELAIDDGGVTKLRTVRVQDVKPYANTPRIVIITLLAGDSRWHAAAATSAVGHLTATGQTVSLTNAGNATDDRPVFILKPTVQKPAANAWKYRRYANVANRVNRSLLDWPLELTNAGSPNAFGHAALVTAVKSQADGDDVRVLLNGREIPRYFGENGATDPNSAGATVWATPKLSAMMQVHLLAAITNVSPANGGELQVLRGEVRGWPKVGRLMHPTTFEVFSYTGWTEANASGNAAFTGIKRAQLGSTATAASAGDQLLRHEHKIEIVYGHTGIGAPESRPESKPLLDLTSATLTKIRHEWIEFYDGLYPSRPGGWVRSLEARDNGAGFIVLPNSLTGPAATVPFEYVYNSPPAAKDNFNVLRREFPVGTDGSASQLAFNRVLDATMALWLLGVQVNGTERILDRLFGALASATYTYAAGEKFYEIGFYARSGVVLSTPGLPALSNMDFIVAAVNTASAGLSTINQIFASPAELQNMRGVYVYVNEPAGALVAITMSIFGDDGSGGIEPDAINGLTIATGQLGASTAWAGGLFSAPTSLIPGNKWHIGLAVPGGTHSSVLWRAFSVPSEGQYPLKTFLIIGDGEIDVDARGVETDKTTIDNVVVKFDTAGVPLQWLSAELDCYWLSGTLVNQTTLQQLTFGLFVTTNDSIEIDVGKRTVTNLTTGETGLLYGMTPSDNEAWLSAVPGANVYRWDEAGCAGLDLTVSLVARWE